MKLLVAVWSFVIVLAASVFAAVPAGAAGFTPDSGSGTVSDPYIFTTCVGLQSIGDYVAAHAGAAGVYFRLGSNVDCTASSSWNGGNGFVSIGTSAQPFAGHFDGAGHVISGLYDHNSATDIGLFGVIGSGAMLADVGLENANMQGLGDVGILVGNSQSGSTITNTYATGSVTGTGTDGGLVGLNQGTITNSYTNAAMSSGFNGGGLAGRNEGAISNSYAIGNVSGALTAGGLVGVNAGTVTNSYASGAVTGTTHGALFGTNSGTVGGGSAGGVTASVFNQTSPLHAVYLGSPAWDFASVWRFADASSLPVLRPIAPPPSGGGSSGNPGSTGQNTSVASTAVTAPNTGAGQQISAILQRQ